MAKTSSAKTNFCENFFFSKVRIHNNEVDSNKLQVRFYIVYYNISKFGKNVGSSVEALHNGQFCCCHCWIHSSWKKWLHCNCTLVSLSGSRHMAQHSPSGASALSYSWMTGSVCCVRRCCLWSAMTITTQNTVLWKQRTMEMVISRKSIMTTIGFEASMEA